MAIGDVYVGAFLAALFEKLASPDVREFAKRLKILPHLQKLERRLWTTQQLLDDAENKQTKDEAVNTWLRDLRDWAYDADDLLDELATKSKLKTATDVVYTNMATSSSIAGFITKEVRALSCYMDDILYGYGYEAAAKIDEIRARLESFYARKARLGLKVGVSNTGETWQRTPVASLGFHPNIYGRADVEQQIINLLLGIGTGQRRPGANKLDVVAIVGMGGIGKTTLARHVFNNASVEKHFELKGWVSVSSTQFDVARATKAILEELKVDMGEVAHLGLNGLQTKLKDKQGEEENKKFLLVLDDVWFTSYDDWDCLRSPFFLAAAPGSKVIVTTRHEAVASVMCAVERFTLEGLSDGDCLSVFRQHAFENDPSTSYPDVEPFRPKILKICKGLPLAARVLGASLRDKQPNHWEATLNSDLWGLLEAEDGILSSLWLSYLHLPSHLKRCFSYCSVLPKNYEFEEEELVLLWMAEGLIGYQTGVDMEDLGRQYFRELLSRSLFQYASDHESRFVMHDHIHYLATFVAGKSYVNLEDGLKVDLCFGI